MIYYTKIWFEEILNVTFYNNYYSPNETMFIFLSIYKSLMLLEEFGVKAVNVISHALDEKYFILDSKNTKRILLIINEHRSNCSAL